MTTQTKSIITRNNVKVSGTGQPLIFSNGYGCSQQIWRHVAKAFQDQYQIILFDHVGSGDSDMRAYDLAKYSSLQGYAEDLQEICQSLNLHNPIVIGHSIGSIIAALCEVKNPGTFAKLVMVGPSPCYENKNDYRGAFDTDEIENILNSMDADFDTWVETSMPFLVNNPDRIDAISELVKSFKNTNHQVAKYFALTTFFSDSREAISHISIPTLILQAREDSIVPDHVSEYLHREITPSTLVKLKATGHFPHLVAPDEVNDAIQKFLKNA